MIHMLPSVRIYELSDNAVGVIKCLSEWSNFIIGNTITITSAAENTTKHASDSRHYLDRAFDIRSKDKTNDQISDLVQHLFTEMPYDIRIKIELSDTDKHWVTAADQIRFPEKRSANQHIHLEWLE